MRIVSFTEARNGLKGVLDQVVNDADYTVITRCDGEDAVAFERELSNG
jgi:antitoxin YefM